MSKVWRFMEEMVARAIVDSNDNDCHWQLAREIHTDDGHTFFDPILFTRENTTRLAACWNYCHGIRTDELTSRIDSGERAETARTDRTEVLERIALADSLLEAGGAARTRKALEAVKKARSILERGGTA